VFRRSVIDAIPTGRAVSVERETFPALLAAHAVVVGIVDDAYWRDLGTAKAYVRGSADVVLGRVDAPARPGPAGPALVLAGAVVIGDAHLSGGTSVSAGCRVGAGSTVHGSVLMDGARIGDGAVVRSSAVGRGARIGTGAVVDRAVVAAGAAIGPGERLGPAWQ
jgi:mannose-1-phosphate guanylyltransferase